MLRRQVLSLLLASAARSASRKSAALDRFLDPARGCALLLDALSGEVIASNSSPVVNSILVPPGSTLKPFVLSALLAHGRMRVDEAFACPERLTLAGHRMDCSHPRLAAPVTVETALAYSCNCFVAHFAERVAPGQLAGWLQVTARITPQSTPDLQKLQALGVSGVLVTPADMAQAFRKLVIRRDSAIVGGLEAAVDYGTAQLARVRWATLAGKTGSARTQENFIAWFAGFVPSRAPRVVITVMLSGRHGGSDAAPIAAQILDAWHEGRL